MKHGANRLAEYLNDNAITAMAIHGNKSQTARTRALAEFKSGDLQVLVATDIAARGIDIDQLPHVVNFEMPNVPEDYVHRIGRTGRAGAQGRAVSLVCVDEDIFLRDIERLIKRTIPREVVPGFEPDPNERAEPIVTGRTTIGVRGPASSNRGTSRGPASHASGRGPSGGNAGRGASSNGSGRGSSGGDARRGSSGNGSSSHGSARNAPGPATGSASNDRRSAAPHDRLAPTGPRPSHPTRNQTAPHGARPAAPHGSTSHGSGPNSSAGPRQRSALTSSRKDSGGDR
jgi:ATP-dependent RNA helicase RhlE